MANGDWGQIMFIDNHSRQGTGVVPCYSQLHGDTGRNIWHWKVSITAREELKRVFALTGRKPVPAAMTGLEIPMGNKESSNNISYSLGAHHLFSGQWKLTTNFGWPGGPPRVRAVQQWE